MEKGLLTKAVENKVSSLLDELVKLPGIWEQFDGLAFKLVIGQLDDNFGEKVQEPYKSVIQDIATQVFEEKDYKSAITIALTFIDSQVDIPGIDDPTELAIFKGLEYIIFALLAKMNTDGQA